MSSRKIKLFAQDNDVIQDQICMVQGVKLKGVKRINSQRTGDIAGMRAKDDKDNYWSIFIEGKNRTDQGNLNKGLNKLFSHAKRRNTKNEIFIYLSYHQIKNPKQKSNFDSVNNNLYLIIDGIKKEDFTLDIKFLSNPKERVTFTQLLEKLSPLILPKITSETMKSGSFKNCNQFVLTYFS